MSSEQDSSGRILFIIIPASIIALLVDSPIVLFVCYPTALIYGETLLSTHGSKQLRVRIRVLSAVLLLMLVLLEIPFLDILKIRIIFYIVSTIFAKYRSKKWQALSIGNPLLYILTTNISYFGTLFAIGALSDIEYVKLQYLSAQIILQFSLRFLELKVRNELDFEFVRILLVSVILALASVPCLLISNGGINNVYIFMVALALSALFLLQSKLNK